MVGRILPSLLYTPNRPFSITSSALRSYIPVGGDNFFRRPVVPANWGIMFVPQQEAWVFASCNADGLMD